MVVAAWTRLREEENEGKEDVVGVGILGDRREG